MHIERLLSKLSSEIMESKKGNKKNIHILHTCKVFLRAFLYIAIITIRYELNYHCRLYKFIVIVSLCSVLGRENIHNPPNQATITSNDLSIYIDTSFLPLRI